MPPAPQSAAADARAASIPAGVALRVPSVGSNAGPREIVGDL